MDTMSYATLMQYVKEDIKYTEIGGVYVSKREERWMEATHM